VDMTVRFVEVAPQRGVFLLQPAVRFNEGADGGFEPIELIGIAIGTSARLGVGNERPPSP
jgi:hypothetical protein